MMTNPPLPPEQESLQPEHATQLLQRQDMLLPAYRTKVYSTDIYDAILQYNVRTPAQFDAYLARHGKPTRSKPT